MAYIGYQDTENLLSSYNMLEAILESLTVELDAFDKEDELDIDTEIAGMTFAGHAPSDMPRPPEGHTSDNTAKIAVNLRGIAADRDRATRNEIKREILVVNTILQKIQIAFKRIPKIQREITWAFYIEDLTWKEISKRFHIMDRYAQKHRQIAIRRISKIAHIDIDTYKKAIDLIKIEDN